MERDNMRESSINGALGITPASRGALLPRRLLLDDGVREGLEELRRQLAGRSGDQSAAKLGQLAADLGPGGVAQNRLVAAILQLNHRAALGETGSAA